METEVKITNGYHNGYSETDDSHEVNKNTESKETKVVLKLYNLKNTTEVSNGKKVDCLDGPNQVLPASEHSTTSANGCIKLRLGTEGISADPPLSVPGLLNTTVARYPDIIALASKKSDGTWEKITYREFQQQVFTCAKAFLKLGLERHHAVGIIGFNSAEWITADLAAIHAGGMAAGIYTTNTPEACYHVLSNSQANIVVVECDKQMEKIRAIWPKLPHLKAAIQWEGQSKVRQDNVYTWEEIMHIGRSEPDIRLFEVLKSIAINECCTLVYTSGTVGQPKGTMLSHDNLVWEASAITKRIEMEQGNERIVSFLPLSHVAAQMVDIYLSITNAVSIYFADKDALKGSLLKTLQEVEPTRLIAVPRVWEKMHEKMVTIGQSNGMIKQLIGGWAKQQSLNHYMGLINGSNHSSYGYKLAKMIVLNKVRAALGLSKCRLFVSAAAPLSVDIKKYFLSLDIPIMDVFGMSELSGAHTLSVLSAFNLESIGKPLSGVETKLDNIDPQTGDGEICLRGRHTFMGYLDEPEKTQETLDKEGWLHSGDLGKIDKNGFVYITGRLKELLITAGGENVAPVLIEQTIKSELPIISHAMVIGDGRKYLSILLTLKTEVDIETGTPLDKFTGETLRWLEKYECFDETVPELKKNCNVKVWKAIYDGINRANTQAISNAQKVQKFTILPSDFSIPTDELGPTMKMKRSVIANKYKSIIEEMYANDDNTKKV